MVSKKVKEKYILNSEEQAQFKDLQKAKISAKDAEMKSSMAKLLVLTSHMTAWGLFTKNHPETKDVNMMYNIKDGCAYMAKKEDKE